MDERARKEYESVVLAALLHDIGKFMQRAGLKLDSAEEGLVSSCKYAHAVHSGRFIRTYLNGLDEVEILAMYHHAADNAQQKRLAKIIMLADWLASGERRGRDETEELGKPKKEPLISIFSRISLAGRQGVAEHYVPIGMLSPALEGLFPVKSKEEALSADSRDPRSFNALWNLFINDIKKIDRVDLFNQLMFLLEKYTVCIPSAAFKDKPDLSLYHHVKSSAAIAACLYRKGITEEEMDSILKAMRIGVDDTVMDAQQFLLVGGDISGIQNFIYSVTSSKALRGLRGRSVYLQFLADTIARKVLDAFDLPMANLLYCGGGHFYVLLPLIEDVVEHLITLKREIDAVLLNAHHGVLSAAIAWRKVSCADIMSFDTAWDDLGQQLAREKRRKFSELVVDKEKHISIFGPTAAEGAEGACSICGEMIKKKDICPLCESFAELSAQLSSAKSLRIIRTRQQGIGKAASAWHDIFYSLGYDYTLNDQLRNDALLINSTDFAGSAAGFVFIAHATPIGSKGAMTLENIAEESDGISKWGVLRADVDDLSQVFKEGLGEDRTMSRLSMLSHMLSLFFSARIDSVIGKQFQREAYMVYSGGDDVFILGAWSALPEIAKIVREEFRAFTCGSLSMSGGIYLAPSTKYPVYQAALEAGLSVNKAKAIEGKDRLTLFDRPVPWHDLGKLIDLKTRIVKLLRDGDKPVPRSLLGTLYIGAKEDELVQKGEISMPRLWRLFYAFRKLMRGYKEKDPQLAGLNELLTTCITENAMSPYTDIAVRWADYLTRKEEA